MAMEEHMNYAKMANAVLFFLAHAQKVGKTKLAKLLYFADFGHYAEHGRSITGEMYVKYQHGPFPSRMEFILKKMRSDGVLEWETRPIVDYQGYCFDVKTPCDETVFTPEELATLRAVVDKWRDATAGEVEEASHKCTPWMAADDLAYLDYSLAVCSTEEEPEDEELRKSPVLRELVKGLE